MGKGALLIVAAGVMAGSMMLYQARQSSGGAEAVQSDQQEKVLAREIARSAYGAALSEARKLDNQDKTPEEIAQALGSPDNPTPGDYQGGDFEYWAELIAGSTYRIGARGTYNDASYAINGARAAESLLECEKESGCTIHLDLKESTAGYCSAVFLQRYIPKDNSGHGNNQDHDDPDNSGSSGFADDNDDDEMVTGNINSRFQVLEPDLVFKPGNGKRDDHLGQTYDQTLAKGTRFNIILAVDTNCSMEGQSVTYDADFDHYQKALTENVDGMQALKEGIWAITEEHAENSGTWRLGFEDRPKDWFSTAQLLDVKKNGYPPFSGAGQWDGETYGGDGWTYENDDSGYLKLEEKSGVPDFNDQVMTVCFSSTGSCFSPPA